MGVIDPNPLPFSPDEPDRGLERFALIASELIRLRFAAERTGSAELVARLEDAIVQACRDAGIGPPAGNAAVAKWLAVLLDRAEKTNLCYRAAQPTAAPALLDAVLQRTGRGIITERPNEDGSQNPRSDPDRPGS